MFARRGSSPVGFCSTCETLPKPRNQFIITFTGAGRWAFEDSPRPPGRDRPGTRGSSVTACVERIDRASHVGLRLAPSAGDEVAVVAGEARGFVAGTALHQSVRPTPGACIDSRGDGEIARNRRGDPGVLIDCVHRERPGDHPLPRRHLLNAKPDKSAVPRALERDDFCAIHLNFPSSLATRWR